jgi:hypothetical protein
MHALRVHLKVRFDLDLCKIYPGVEECRSSHLVVSSDLVESRQCGERTRRDENKQATRRRCLTTLAA